MKVRIWGKNYVEVSISLWRVNPFEALNNKQTKTFNEGFNAEFPFSLETNLQAVSISNDFPYKILHS